LTTIGGELAGREWSANGRFGHRAVTWGGSLSIRTGRGLSCKSFHISQ
jgi:hypothetical protein